MNDCYSKWIGSIVNIIYICGVIYIFFWKNRFLQNGLKLKTAKKIEFGNWIDYNRRPFVIGKLDTIHTFTSQICL